MEQKQKIPITTSWDKFDWDGKKMKTNKDGTETQDTHYGFFQQVQLRDLPQHDLLHNKDGNQEAWWGQAKDSDVVP